MEKTTVGYDEKEKYDTCTSVKESNKKTGSEPWGFLFVRGLVDSFACIYLT